MAKPGYIKICFCPLVEVCYDIRYPFNHRLCCTSCMEHPIHHLVRREPFHLDRIFNRIPFAFKHKSAVLLIYLYHADIDIRRKPLVQGDLLMAEKSSLFKGCKIQKAEINRFFYFIDIFGGKEKIGDMSLSEFYCVRQIRTGLFFQQCAYNRRKRHISSLFHHIYTRQVSVFLIIVKAVSYKENILCIEAKVIYFYRHLSAMRFVNKRAGF